MARPDMYNRTGPSGMRPPDFPPVEAPIPPAPSQPKKRRKTAANAANAAIQPTPPPTPADLLPPQPLSGYGDTLIASNPFDDTPPSTPSMNMQHMAPHPHHMNMSPHHHPAHPPHHMNHHPPPGMGANGPMRPMNPMMMNNPGMGPGIGPPPHMQMNHHMNSRGSMSPMGVAPMGGLSPMGGMNPNLSPMGLQHGMQHGMNQMGPGRPINSPMTPLGTSPMHSPLANGPPGNRINGMNPMNPQQSPHHMGNAPPPPQPPGGGNNSNLTPLNVNNSSPTTSLPIGTPNSNLNNNANNLPGSNNPNSMPVSGGPSPMSNPSMSNSPASMSMMSPMMGPNGQMGGMMPNQGGPNPGGPQMGGNPNQMYSGPPKPMPVSAGKVYPSDTPMVFNPQNPNAPPIYPCGVCHKEVHDNDQGILCESGCNFWFHR